MSLHHHTINLSRSARRVGLAVQHLCGRLLIPLLLIFMFSAGFTASAYADGAQRTRAQAIEIAKSRSGDGRVLSVKKTVNKNGKSVFAVKIIVNGRVKVYAIPEFAN